MTPSNIRGSKLCTSLRVNEPKAKVVRVEQQVYLATWKKYRMILRKLKELEGFKEIGDWGVE